MAGFLVSSSGFVRVASAGLGLAYPALLTYKALTEPHHGHRSQGLKDELLTYWSLVGLLTAAEQACDPMVKKVPLYYHGKFVFLTLLLADNCQGAADAFGFLKARLGGATEELNMFTSYCASVVGSLSGQVRMVAKWGLQATGISKS